MSLPHHQITSMPPTIQSPAALSGIKCQKREKKPYSNKPGPKPKDPNAPAASNHKSAALIAETKAKLTMGDWMSVFQWKDAHNATQAQTVNEFKSQTKGRLIFSQATLSDAQKRRPQMEALIEQNPLNASRLCAQVVVCPEVEKALFYWSKSMEERNKLVMQAMLVEKRMRLEAAMNIPEEQRLRDSTGWTQSFCKT
jgi:hypothetical protein